jgi:Lrp/AsnC family transcriptional regulator for asnA, asnC and gidA
MPEYKGSTLDELDIDILIRLIEDGRVTFSDIADALGVSRGTVRNRYLSMKSDDFLEFYMWINPKKMGVDAYINMRISIQAEELENAISIIVGFPEVTWLTEMIDEYNVLCDVVCRDMDHLHHFINHMIHPIEGVKEVKTYFYAKYHKNKPSYDKKFFQN